MTHQPLTTDDLRGVIVDAIGSVAPDVGDEAAELRGDVDLWDELGLDSMDQLNVVVVVHERVGVEIPERHYGQLRTLDSFAAYLAEASS